MNLLKILLRWLVFIISIAGIALYATIIFPLTRSEQIKPSDQQSDFGLPVTLKIPRITVNSHIEYVGLTPDGFMDVPKGPDNVAWLNISPRPGENGSAVVAGHSGWKNNTPAVFDNLYELRIGDKLYVEDEKGTTISFIVREIKSYDLNANAEDVFSSDDQKAHLNLITCEGVWDNLKKSRSERLIVFTDKE